MKRLTNIFVSLLLGSSTLAWAADEAKTSNAKQATTNTQSQTPATNTNAAKSEKTEHNFEDLLVQGKYHFSDEAVTTVEEDKVLDSLLGIRTDFKDKIEQSAGRY